MTKIVQTERQVEFIRTCPRCRLSSLFAVKIVQAERRTKEFTPFYPETQPIFTRSVKVVQNMS